MVVKTPDGDNKGMHAVPGSNPDQLGLDQGMGGWPSTAGRGEKPSVTPHVTEADQPPIETLEEGPVSRRTSVVAWGWWVLFWLEWGLCLICLGGVWVGGG